MTPEVLADWTLNAIEQLVATGIFESRRFDFKEMLPGGNDAGGKARLRKTLAAFANSNGGFLVIGIKDDRTLGATERIVGVDAGTDVPERLGAQAGRCTPAVQWTLRNPPHRLASGRLVHVVEIHEAHVKPHGLFDGERWIFPKRTERGNEAMSYEELRGAFRDRQALIAATRILRAEASRMVEHATGLNIELQTGGTRHFIFLRFRPAMFEAAWVQVLGQIELESSFVKVVQSLLDAVHACDDQTTRLLTEGGNASSLIRLVLQVLNHAGLAEGWLKKLLL